MRQVRWVVPELPSGGWESSFLSNRDFEREIGRVGYHSLSVRVRLHSNGRENMDIQMQSRLPPMRQAMDVTSKRMPNTPMVEGMTRDNGPIQLRTCSTSWSGRCKGCRERSDEAEMAPIEGNRWTIGHGVCAKRRGTWRNNSTMENVEFAAYRMQL